MLLERTGDDIRVQTYKDSLTRLGYCVHTCNDHIGKYKTFVKGYDKITGKNVFKAYRNPGGYWKIIVDSNFLELL